MSNETFSVSIGTRISRGCVGCANFERCTDNVESSFESLLEHKKVFETDTRSMGRTMLYPIDLPEDDEHFADLLNTHRADVDEAALVADACGSSRMDIFENGKIAEYVCGFDNQQYKIS